MIDALRYEWLRITTIRSTYWISGITLVFCVGLSFLVAMASSFAFDSEGAPAIDEITFLAPALATQFASLQGPYIVAYIATIIAVFAWGHEYRHGMIRATLTAQGSRVTVWVAKYLVVAGWCLALVVTAYLLSSLVSWLWLQDDGLALVSDEWFEQFGRTVYYSLIFVWIAAAATSILRNQTAALVAVYLWPLAIEPLIRLMLFAIPNTEQPEKLARYLPFNAGDRVIRNSEAGRALDAFLGGEQISTEVGFVVFTGFAALAMAVSLVLFTRRDA
ncbi:MAG TPA: hypothetical protein VLI04_18325 [Nocardioidaceae bacterium]|nr:hypothetical protein [Nocardioidaceae bacterium]